MDLNTTPNAARGEVSLTIAGQRYLVRFSLNVLRDWTKLTGVPPTDFGQCLTEDYVEAFSGIIACAVRRYVPELVSFTQEQAVDLMEEIGEVEAAAVAEAIVEATTTINPILGAMTKQLAAKQQALSPAAPSENGADSSTSASAS